MSPATAPAAVTQRERETALAMVSDWADNATADGARISTAHQLELCGVIADALACARDGAYADGRRHTVETHLDVVLDRWTHDPGAERNAVRHLRRYWTGQLMDQGLRPLTWPPITRTFYRWRDLELGEGPPTFGDPFVECDEPDAYMVRLTISGLAVAE